MLRPLPGSWITAVLACVAVVLFTTWGIVSTYTAFSQAYDEPAHLACGMEWLDRGTYTYETQHPPLSRIVGALGPYLSGMRAQNKPDKWEEGNEILHSSGDYRGTLVLARLGMLPFFLLLTVIVALWAMLLYDRETAVAAVIALCGIPALLGSSGLVYTDVPFTATFCGSLLAFSWWLRQPNMARALAAGFSAGVALVTKFSFMVFYPVCVAVLLGLELLERRRAGKCPSVRWHSLGAQTAVALLAVLLVVMAMYRFEFGPLRDPSHRPYEVVDALVGTEGLLHDVVYRCIEWPYYPAVSLVDGLESVASHARTGHRQAFFGEVRFDGIWYYFPVLLALKTPLPFLALAAIGAMLLIGTRARRPFTHFGPLLCGTGILLAVLPSTINLGLRHVFPIYPLLALVAGFGAMALFRHGLVQRAIAVTLLGAPLVICAAVRPDYLSYVNLLAFSYADTVEGGADFDRSQSLYALRAELQRREVDQMSLAYRGRADPMRHGLPQFRLLQPHERATGWVVVNTTFLVDDRSDAPPYDGYHWLTEHEPISRTGGFTIYYVPEEPGAEVDGSAALDESESP